MRFTSALAALLAIVVSGVSAAADKPLTAPRTAEAQRFNSYARIAPLGDGAVAVWWADNELRSMRLDANGHPRDASSRRIAATGPLDALHLTSNGSQTFVAWTGQSGTYVAPVQDDGRLGNAFQLHKWGILPAGLAVSNDRVVMVAPVANSAMATIASLDGTVLATDVTIGVTPPNSAMPAGDVAAVGDSFIFSWVNTGDGRIHAVQLTAGQVVTRSFTPAGDLLQLPGRQGASVRVATNGNGSMLVFQDYDETIGRYVLRVRALSAAGNALGTPLNIMSFAGAATALPPTIAPSGDGYVVAALEQAGNASILTVLNLDSAGSVQQSRFLSLPAMFWKTAIQVKPTPTADVVILRNAAPSVPKPQVYTIKANRDGGELEAPQLISAAAEIPWQEASAIFPTAEGWLAAWREDGAASRAVVGRLDRNGVALTGAGVTLMPEGGNQQSVAAAWSGSEMLVVWSADAFYGAIVKPGEWPPRSPFRIGSGSGSVLQNIAGISVAWDGSEFVAVWQSSTSTIGATRIGRDGSLLDSKPVPITPADAPDVFGAVNPTLSWNGSEFLVVFGRRAREAPAASGNNILGLAAQRLSRNLILQGQPFDVSELAFGNGSPVHFSQAVASGTSWLVSWVQNSELRGFQVNSDGTRSGDLHGLYPAQTAPHVAALAGGWLVTGGASAAQVSRAGARTPFQPILPAGSEIDALTVAGSRMAIVYSIDGTAYVHFTEGHARPAGH
jgi:hypothetical protein